MEDITEKEWEALGEEKSLPVLTREDGSLLVFGGIWSLGQRKYEYSTVEIAGMPVKEAVEKKLVVAFANARGKDVEEYRFGSDTGYDRGRVNSTHSTGIYSKISAYAVPANTPTRVKFGSTYRSSSGNMSGSSHVHFFGGPTSAPAYRSQSAKFVKDRQIQREELER